MKIWRIIILWMLLLNADLEGQDFAMEQFDFPYKHALIFAQSDDGFIWMGHHYGLIRFDGSNYKFFRHNPKDSTSIPSGLITKIYHKDNKLWLCSVTDGVAAFDLITYQCKTWKSIPNDSFSLASNYARGIWPEKDTSIWVATHSFCLNRLNPISDRVERYLPKIPDKTFTSYNQAGLLTGPIPDPNNDQYLWMGSKFGFYRFNKADKTFTLFPDKSNQIDPNLVECLIRPFFDNEGMIWSSWKMNQLPGIGLSRFDPIQNEWQTFKYSDSGVENFSTNRLTQIYQMNDSLIVAGSNAEKLWIFNKRTLEIINPSKILHKAWSNISTVYSFLHDHADQLWLASGDLFRVREVSQPFEYHNTSGVINKSIDVGWTNCFVEDDELSKIYIGTRNGEGLLVLNDEFKVIGQYLHESQWDINSINDMLVLDNHDVLVATNNGPFLYDHRRQSIVKIVNPDLVHQQIGGIKKYKTDDIWLSVNGNTLVSYNLNENKLKRASRLNDAGFSDYSIVDMEFQDSILWLGCNNGLLKYHIEFDSFEFVEALNGIRIYDLELVGNSLYIGTSTKGLMVHLSNRGNSDIWENYTVQDGLSGQQVFEVLPLRDGSIWLGSEPGFTHFLPEEKRFIQYHVEDGVPFNRQSGKLLQIDDGRILSPASSGFYSFDPNAFERDIYKPVAYIDEIKIPGREGFRPSKSLVLEPQEGSISISFGATDYCTRIKTRYEYILANYDETWSKKISSDPIVYNKIPYGDYSFKLIAINNKGVRSDILELPITIKTPFVKTIWFWTLLLFASIVILLTIFRYRLNQIRREQKIRTEYNNKIATLEMEALRSQMNPHFLFNSLNSINRFIIKKDPKLASDYLTKFARLVRMILNNSKQEHITLKEEMDSLKLYIEMEKLRFDEMFDFNINLLSNQNPENIYVPSMIVQPYIENAIWHGLMHKKENRRLEIDVKVDKSHILFEISDNGVGRKRSRELKSKSSTHKSFGMKITKNRIDLINTKNESKASVQVEDLFDDNGIAVGTKVNLKLPIIKIENNNG